MERTIRKVYICCSPILKNTDLGRWSRGMIPRLQRGDHEFESRPAHCNSTTIFKDRIILK